MFNRDEYEFSCKITGFVEDLRVILRTEHKCEIVERASS